ncbi:MAG TPA: hypothetical protein VGA53_01275 [Candidatus Paceibacterota bacterium]
MNQMDFSKLKFPFFVLVAAVIITAGGMLALQNFVKPTPIAQTQEDTPSLSLLNNIEYYHSYCEVPMKLTDGVFQWTENFLCNQEPTFGFLFQIYNEKIAIGDLNFDGKSDAAVVLATNYGGSGNFRELAVVLSQDGTFKHVASVDIGDRVIVNEISIQSSRILLDMVVHGPEDGACCPTQAVLKIFRFDVESQELIEI